MKKTLFTHRDWKIKGDNGPEIKLHSNDTSIHFTNIIVGRGDHLLPLPQGEEGELLALISC